MADYNLKDDLLGFGRSQLKYMLFHNSTLADLDEYSYRKGLFFYDTDLDSLEFIKDNLTGWHSTISMVSSNNPSFVSDNDISDRFLIGAKEYSVARGFNPGVAGFLVIDEDGYPISQNKILFEDIEPTDYTTTITAPGLDTRFATEKAIVDYVSTVLLTPQDNILDWDGTKYLPFDAKKVSDPGYAYFYTGTALPSFVNNRLTLDGSLYARGLHTRITSNTGESLGGDGSIRLLDANNTFVATTSANDTFLYGLKLGVKTPIYIGQTLLSTDDGLTIDANTNLFEVNLTTIKFTKGTANKYLYLDGSKNITYVDAPSGGVTPVDNILDWDTDAYKPYTSKTVSAFYTGITVPDAVATVLNYDGVFRATQLYEGSTRVMTTHGNWTANGSLHAVTTTAHAGFCPQLPAVATGLFLRDDGTWGVANFWKRTSTYLSPATANDKLEVISNTNLTPAIYGRSTGALGYGVHGASLASYPLVGQQTSTVNNDVKTCLYLVTSSYTAGAVGAGAEIKFAIKDDTTTPSTARIISKLTDATHATVTSSLEWWLINSGTEAKKMELTGAGELIVANAKLTGLATYADNTAATGGGLTAGQIYRTSTGELMVTY